MAVAQERRATAIRHLRTLDLEPGAQLADVKAARLTLIKIWHPDRLEHDPELRAKGEARLKEIDAAYTWLCEHAQGLAELPGEGSARGSTPEMSSRLPRWVHRVPTPLRVALASAMLVGLLVTIRSARDVVPEAPLDLDSTAAHPVVVRGQLYIVQASQLNVRESPSAESPVVGRLSLGDPVLAVQFRDGWGHVVEPVHGWVHSRFLTR